MTKGVLNSNLKIDRGMTMKKLLIATLLFLTVGCVKIGVMMLTDTRYPPKPKNYNVEVFLAKSQPDLIKRLQ